ncbi:MAG TPA: hypothetical protein VKU41_13045 [Polyangiaceae bacterium]|nr:hypothetical protein [Polyangiaceae bacterium]
MSATRVNTPFFDGGLTSIKFFNGRLLSGDDLSTEQTANIQARERLGLALGDGVVNGLEVTASGSATQPTVTVQSGLAFNRSGDAVQLANTVDVGLYAPAAPAANIPSPSPFTPCGPADLGVYLSTAGVYLLTIAPASGTQGRAPVLGLADGSDKCNAKYLLEGVQFRLAQLPIAASDLANTAQLRNIVAARCFGFTVDPLIDPFGTLPPPQRTPAPQGIIEALWPDTLSLDEVPLAVVSWTANAGITFVDMWSARRRLSRSDAADDTVLPITRRDVARGEAILLQFQDQLQSILAGSPASFSATSAFKYLPPLGLLPLPSTASRVGFSQATFFQGLTVTGPIDIEGARAEAMIRESFRYPPVDLSTGEMFWTFQTRQNAQSSTARPYLFFVTGQMPYFGEARYDVARFDYAAWT